MIGLRSGTGTGREVGANEIYYGAFIFLLGATLKYLKRSLSVESDYSQEDATSWVNEFVSKDAVEELQPLKQPPTREWRPFSTPQCLKKNGRELFKVKS